MRLVTVRHGLTTANEQRLASAFGDELSATGEAQARAAGEKCADREWDVVIASTAPRAIRTAALTTGLPPESIQVDPQCLERDCGEVAGLAHEQVLQDFPAMRHMEIKGVQYSLDPPGGETLEQLRTRAEQFLQSLVARYPDREVAVFSHGNFLQQLFGALDGLDTFECLHLDLTRVYNLAMNEYDVEPDLSANFIGHELLAPSASLTGVY